MFLAKSLLKASRNVPNPGVACFFFSFMLSIKITDHFSFTINHNSLTFISVNRTDEDFQDLVIVTLVAININ